VLAVSPYAWQADFDTTVVVPTLGLAYLFLAGRYAATRREVTLFSAGLVLVALAFWSPLHHLGLHYLLTAHLLQNVILAEWAPLLVAASIPAAAAAATSRFRVFRFVTAPAFALPTWLLGYYAWHVPAIYDAALRNPPLIHAEHAWYFLSGVLMWWPVVQSRPRDLASIGRAGYAFAAFVLGAPLGLLLALIPHPIYAFYVAVPTRVWGLSPLTDQQIAGVTMASEQALVLACVCGFWFRRFLHEEGAT
jgi:cytochrome c oxidase assembly factor CtaG